MTANEFAADEFEGKKERALAHLARTGIWQSNYAPPLFRMLWSVGVRVPPPHFIPFAAAALLMGSVFAILLFGVAMVLGVAGPHAGLGTVAVTDVLAGTFFGLSMAAYYKFGRTRYGLPAWDRV